MIKKISQTFNDWAQRFMPDPFIFAILLTFITFVASFILSDFKSTPAAQSLQAKDAGYVGFVIFKSIWIIECWEKGFWEFLTFGMQMCLILITGYTLADSKLIRSGLSALSRIPQNGASAVAITAFVTCVAAMINWGLGLIIGALLAKEIGIQGRLRNKKFHYPLLGAAGYTCMMVWHGGLSGSAPLKVASPGHFLEKTTGVIPLSETLGSPMNLIISVVLLILLPLIYYLMMPKSLREIVEYKGSLHESKADIKEQHSQSIAEKIENNMALSMIIGSIGFLAIAIYFWRGGSLTFNMMNFIFMFLGIVLHKTPRSYINSFYKASQSAGGIILQFPFYAGIMGLMKYTGLVAIIAAAMVKYSNYYTFSVLGFLSAGIVNFFVPSGGGQWGVQGPILVEAAQNLGYPLKKAIMMLAYGDEWSNMLQPFWALPLLGITGLKAREIVGYTTVVMLISAIVFILGLWFLPV